MIPILTNLNRDQLKQALPEILSLPDELMKLALHKILSYGASLPSHQLHHYMSPQMVLVALHQMDTGDPKFMRRVIAATNLCFTPAYRNIFRRDVLAAALQVLVDLVPIPSLFMRTVIQSLVNNEDLAPAISGVLARLIKKKLWETKVLWDGFIKCVKMKALRPYVAEVLLQLPQKQLKQVLMDHVELREPVREDVINNKLKGVSEEILAVLEVERNENGEMLYKPGQVISE